MKKNNIYTVAFRRKREGKTHYKKRLKLLTSGKPRLVVRKSLNNIQASIIKYDLKGDIVLVSAHSSELVKLGWKLNRGNIPSAYLVGILLGKKAKNKGIGEAILDIGLNKSVKGSRLYAVLAGALDAGLNIPYDKEILPSMDRIIGEHIAKYALELKKENAESTKQFSNWIKNGIDPKKITDYFHETRVKVGSGK